MHTSLTANAFQTLNRMVLPAVRAGFATPLPIGLGLVVLETTGRTSGRTRMVPVVGFRSGARVTISTVRHDSQWLKNLESDSTAAVWHGGKRRSATASVQRGPLNIVTLDED